MTQENHLEPPRPAGTSSGFFIERMASPNHRNRIRDKNLLELNIKAKLMFGKRKGGVGRGKGDGVTSGTNLNSSKISESLL